MEKKNDVEAKTIEGTSLAQKKTSANFAANLQLLRQKQGMSQEVLAEKLGVSRQSVSKWESAAAYPEMSTLITLCELFHADLDTLLRGNVATSMATDEAGYDQMMDRLARTVSLGVGMILLGISLMMTWQGLWMAFQWNKDLEMIGTALLLLCVLAAVMLFIVVGVQMDHFRQRHPKIQPFYSQAQLDDFTRRFAWWVAIPVAMILADVILLVVLSEPAERMGEAWEYWLWAVFFILMSAAVSALVWAGIQQEKFDIPHYNLENLPEFQRKKELMGTLCAVIMMGATALYISIAAPSGQWGELYWPFAVGGVLCGISSVIVEFVYGRRVRTLKEQQQEDAKQIR